MAGRLVLTSGDPGGSAPICVLPWQNVQKRNFWRLRVTQGFWKTERGDSVSH